MAACACSRAGTKTAAAAESLHNTSDAFADLNTAAASWDDTEHDGIQGSDINQLKCRVNSTQVSGLYLLQDFHLLWAQISVYGGDALHAVLAYDASSKWVGDDPRRRLNKKKKTDIFIWMSLAIPCFHYTFKYFLNSRSIRQGQN